MTIRSARPSVPALALMLSCGLAALAPANARAQSLRGLGAPGGGGTVSVSGISGDGATVFGIILANRTGYTWTAAAGGTWTQITSPFSIGTLAASTTDGSVIIGTDFHSGLSDSHAARWGSSIFDEFVPLPNHSRDR